jgi:riboflavin biosynthesis pyrimidine reductase
LPNRLRAVYDGDLRFPAASIGRPYVVANFVSTLDGVVSFNLPRQLEGGQISGSNEGDRFIMGLLRASADAVMIGSGTFRAVGSKGLWTPEFVFPSAKDLYRQYREKVLKKPNYPLVVVVSGTGNLDLQSATFHKPDATVLIITTERGKRRLVRSGADGFAEVRATRVSAKGGIEPSAILQLLWQEFSVRFLLHEGGPTLLGGFLAGALVDELFLTIAPQIAGRISAHPRPGLVEGFEFSPHTARWWRLLSVRQAADYVYLRYQAKEISGLKRGFV